MSCSGWSSKDSSEESSEESQEAGVLTMGQVERVIRASRDVVQSFNLATMVRLSFHDCVGNMESGIHEMHQFSHMYKGGCDGCINKEDTFNNGLFNLVADLEEVYISNGFRNLLSRYRNTGLLT